MKKIICAVLVGTMLFSMTACAKEEPKKTEVNINVADEKETETSDTAEEKNINAKEIADALLNEISYKDELAEMNLDIASNFYDFSGIEIAESYIYESSGATAEEIVVLKCKDSDGASKAKELFNNRVKEQIESYTDYVPEEVPKLKDAVIITSKEYAVLCVSDDSSKAKSIIEEAIIK